MYDNLAHTGLAREFEQRARITPAPDWVLVRQVARELALQDEPDFLAAHLLRRYRLTNNVPVPLQDILRALGIELSLESEWPGWYSAAKHDSRGEAKIWIAQKKWLEDQDRARFAVAHELGHLLMSDGEEFTDVYFDQPEDIAPNLFATYLLAPPPQLRSAAMEHGKWDVQHLASRFALSPKLLAPHLDRVLSGNSKL